MSKQFEIPESAKPLSERTKAEYVPRLNKLAGAGFDTPASLTAHQKEVSDYIRGRGDDSFRGRTTRRLFLKAVLWILDDSPMSDKQQYHDELEKFNEGLPRELLPAAPAPAPPALLMTGMPLAQIRPAAPAPAAPAPAPAAPEVIIPNTRTDDFVFEKNNNNDYTAYEYTNANGGTVVRLGAGHKRKNGHIVWLLGHRRLAYKATRTHREGKRGKGDGADLIPEAELPAEWREAFRKRDPSTWAQYSNYGEFVSRQENE